MAKDTVKDVLHQTIYQVFVRQYSEEGSLVKVTEDLERIADMGYDYIYFVPLYPIGVENRKGTYGSPYAITDYRGINPDLGTLDDFKYLLNKAHALGLKVMMDIVFNHTAYDHPWRLSHPEYYYHKANGDFGNRVGDWTDVIELDLSNMDLRKELIDILVYWTSLGVDGFRCDVASLLPLDFWLAAREAIKKVNPHVIWLAESVETNFITALRSYGMHPVTDADLYQAFDVEYAYDILNYFYKALEGKMPLEVWKNLQNMQLALYPENAVKLWTLENHDQERIRNRVKSQRANLNCLAYSFFSKGMAFVYAGQEVEYRGKRDLFEKTPIQWPKETGPYQELLKRLIAFKKEAFFSDHRLFYVVEDEQEAMELRYEREDEQIIGLFDIKDVAGLYRIDLPDGIYKDLLSEREIAVKNGQVDLGLAPFAFKAPLKK
ncbi:alpha-amylase [Atopobacter sp. AH10]|uniref:alpha-amylase family glycosyl hydrolase n=1 Tax=Atopobacter sp. AH10 TaxID=2315861 RepID=UPI000EF1FFB3|nr:alpha-amylase family glycosyl hydrolase [Atopobacter sp. AH10]RLK64216.1 alpha-amylase [Atopobacter sp. AH10]